MTLKHYLVTSLFVFLSIYNANSQGYEPTPGSIAVEYFKNGQIAMVEKNYPLAIRQFEKTLKAQESLITARRLIGQCHFLMGQYPEAVNQYLQILKADSLFSRVIYFELGDAYYKMGKADLALQYFKKFDELQSKPVDFFGLHGAHEIAEELVLKDRLENNIRACEVSIDSIKFINVTDIFNLGKGVNSPKDDYFPFLTNDQQQLYFTRQAEDKDEDLYISRKNSSGEWKGAERLRNFNTDQPEGMSTLVRNGRRLFFTACIREEVAGPCDIWEALMEDNEIQSVSPLGSAVNSMYWESQATVSCDGSQLYFASNRPGGLGGTDIYMTQRMPSGLWSLPVNLGEPLNTPGDEEAPYISNDGKTLYFSSTGHLGLGEQDIFMCWWDNRLGRWSTPINLGPPVNGPHRELGFYLSASGKTGFFASNRPEGEGGMDIYRFELSEKLFGEPITFVEGTVKDSVLLTGVKGLVEINGQPPVMTDEQGRFFLCTGADETLDFSMAVEEYKPYHNQFFIPEWENKSFYTVDLLLRPEFSFLADIEDELKREEEEEKNKPKEKVVRHEMLFSFGSSKLDDAEIGQLLELINTIKGSNIMKVEIVGFADDIGSPSYNLQLSEDRAKHVALFLLERDIEVDDIHIEGKGSLTNDKDRSLNRRVEIRLQVVE